MIDADAIAPGLYQGSVPPEGRELAAASFGLLLLCAEEHQPPAASFPGVQVYYCPFRDTLSPTRQELERADEAARYVANALARGTKVLVTCHMGLNRSGLVSALALVHLGLPPKDAVRVVQTKRHLALSNPTFARVVSERLDDEATRRGAPRQPPRAARPRS